MVKYKFRNWLFYILDSSRGLTYLQLKTHIYTWGSKARYEKMDLKFILPIIIKCRCHHLSNPSSALIVPMMNDSSLTSRTLLTPTINECFNTFKPARTKRESKKKVQYDQLSKKKVEYDQKKQAWSRVVVSPNWVGDRLFVLILSG